jgi:hypothetical protein
MLLCDDDLFDIDDIGFGTATHLLAFILKFRGNRVQPVGSPVFKSSFHRSIRNVKSAPFLF